MTEKMKPSGITWIGDVPESWNLLKLKYFSYLKGRIGWQGLTADEFIDEGPYLITGTDFENGRIQFDRSYHISEARYAQAPEIQLQIGDLLVTKDGTVGKMAYVDELPDKASLNSHLLLIRPLEGKYHNRFLFWLMSSSVFTGYTEYSQDGKIMASLSQEKIGNFLAYFPDLEEQCAIADFLDIHCAKIDSVIADIEKQIETLQKYKKSLITEAVTKGLDRSVPMKDSGVEWIGDIAEDYCVRRLKYLTVIKDGTHDTPDYVDESKDSYPLITSRYINYDTKDIDFEEAKHISKSDFEKIHKRSDVEYGDIIMPMIGTIGNPVIVQTHRKFAIKNVALFKTSVDLITAKYIFYQFYSDILSEQFSIMSRGGVQSFVSLEVLGNLLFIDCTHEEKQQIVEYLDAKCSHIDEVINQKRQQLSVIQQHKKSLIYEYVTGKKRVTEVN